MRVIALLSQCGLKNYYSGFTPTHTFLFFTTVIYKGTSSAIGKTSYHSFFNLIIVTLLP
ncbi:hypothetical protein SPHINGO8BC_150406 [Sphingobacterium multivorum]|uniref:Uncharacterized protein n=1 Tax=Sphingobacterium multivorum TaxID=28454 RepID=A0A654AHS1_SPHMU|nr:hypothetical protein SPHINGO8BC_150406 [Sphingobacterium multivorum]